MKVASVTVTGLMALLQTATANFDVYHQGLSGGGIGENTWGFQVYQNDPSCDDVEDWIWRKSDDVSGGKYGVRCKGDGCNSGGWTSEIDEFEMNFNDDEYHWTIYKSSDWAMYDLADNKIGDCFPFPGFEWHCAPGLARMQGNRIFRCLTDSYTAADINANRPT